MLWVIFNGNGFCGTKIPLSGRWKFFYFLNKVTLEIIIRACMLIFKKSSLIMTTNAPEVSRKLTYKFFFWVGVRFVTEAYRTFYEVWSQNQMCIVK